MWFVLAALRVLHGDPLSNGVGAGTGRGWCRWSVRVLLDEQGLKCAVFDRVVGDAV